MVMWLSVDGLKKVRVALPAKKRRGRVRGLTLERIIGGWFNYSVNIQPFSEKKTTFSKKKSKFFRRLRPGTFLLPTLRL